MSLFCGRSSFEIRNNRLGVYETLVHLQQQLKTGSDHLSEQNTEILKNAVAIYSRPDDPDVIKKCIMGCFNNIGYNPDAMAVDLAMIFSSLNRENPKSDTHIKNIGEFVEQKKLSGSKEELLAFITDTVQGMHSFYSPQLPRESFI